MRRNLIETIMGAVVLLVAGFFVYFAYTTAEISSAPGYDIVAKFGQVGGLSSGSDVQVSGIKVGTVSSVGLDPDTFDAVVVLTIDSSVQLPADTGISIESSGLLGGNYVRLIPGQSDERLTAGSEIAKVIDYKSLEDWVSDIIYHATSASQPGE